MTLVWALSGAWQWMRGLGLRDEARRALIQARFAVLQAESSAWLAAGSLADAALENFK